MSQNIWELKDLLLQRQKRRAQVIKRLLKKSKVKKILDVGCAEGYTTSFISEECPFVVGLEMNMNSLRIAKNKVKEGMFVNASIDYLPFRADCFDIVCILEVLEHLPVDIQRNGLKEADRVLSSKGNIIISVPYKEQIIQTTCIHCKKITPLYGHLHTLDVHVLRSLIPLHFKLIELYHLPNIQTISCSRLLEPVPIMVWLQINNLFGLVRKGYWIIAKFQRI